MRDLQRDGSAREADYARPAGRTGTGNAHPAGLTVSWAIPNTAGEEHLPEFERKRQEQEREQKVADLSERSAAAGPDERQRHASDRADEVAGTIAFAFRALDARPSPWARGCRRIGAS